jgi:hypothetical protein
MTDTTTDETESTETYTRLMEDHDVPPEWPLAEIDVRLELEREDYELVAREYKRAMEAGYPELFDTFLFNQTSANVSIVVDGEEVDPTAPDFGAE